MTWKTEKKWESKSLIVCCAILPTNKNTKNFIFSELLNRKISFFGKKLGRPVFKYRVYKDSKKYSKDIQNILNYYKNNVDNLEDEIKSGKHIGQLLSFIEETEVNLSTKDAPLPPILELGVFRGGTTICFAKFLKVIDSKRKIFACDTFSGFPYDDRIGREKVGKDNSFNEMYDRTQLGLEKTNYDYVKMKYKKFGVENYIEAIKGGFEDTLYQKLSDIKFSFVFSDSDLYKSTSFSLEFLKTRMCERGIIAFHNYGKSEFGTWGETEAVDEFCQKNKMKLNTEKSIPYLKFWLFLSLLDSIRWISDK